MDNHPVGWTLLYETPLGMFCLHGKVMAFGRRMDEKNATFFALSCKCKRYPDGQSGHEEAADADADASEEGDNGPAPNTW